MIDPAVLPAFVAAVFVVTVAPGPDNTYIAAVAVQHGPAAGALSAIGMAAGMSVHVVVTAVGLAALISTNALVLVAIQLVGGLYLAGISWTTLAQIGRRTTLDRGAPPRDLLRRAVLTNLTNPKVVLFFVSFLPQFTRPQAGSLRAQLLVLGAIFLCVGLLCDATIGLTVGMLGRRVGSGGSGGSMLSVIAGATYGVLSAALLRDVAVTFVGY